MKKVIDHPDLMKDESTGAIINTNAAALKEHRLRKKQLQKQQDLEQKYEELSGDVKDIKQMLAQLLADR